MKVTDFHSNHKTHESVVLLEISYVVLAPLVKWTYIELLTERAFDGKLF